MAGVVERLLWCYFVCAADVVFSGFISIRGHSKGSMWNPFGVVICGIGTIFVISCAVTVLQISYVGSRGPVFAQIMFRDRDDICEHVGRPRGAIWIPFGAVMFGTGAVFAAFVQSSRDINVICEVV